VVGFWWDLRRSSVLIPAEIALLLRSHQKPTTSHHA